MTTNDGVINIAAVLTTLANEEELIIKPFQPGSANAIGAIECGKIVSRLNKVLFDYQIGDKTNSSIINSIFSHRIILTNPETKQVVLEYYQNRLPLLCQVCCKQDVQCLTTISDATQSIGSIRQGYV